MASVLLTWNDNSNNETAFYVRRATGTIATPGTFISVGSLSANVTSFIDPSVTPGTNYVYSITAVNGAGESAPAYAEVTVPPSSTVPNPPTGATAVAQ